MYSPLYSAYLCSKSIIVLCYIHSYIHTYFIWWCNITHTKHCIQYMTIYIQAKPAYVCSMHLQFQAFKGLGMTQRFHIYRSDRVMFTLYSKSFLTLTIKWPNLKMDTTYVRMLVFARGSQILTFYILWSILICTCR